LNVEELISALKKIDPEALVLIEGDRIDEEVTTIEVVETHGRRTVILCPD